MFPRSRLFNLLWVLQIIDLAVQDMDFFRRKMVKQTSKLSEMLSQLMQL